MGLKSTVFQRLFKVYQSCGDFLAFFGDAKIKTYRKEDFYVMSDQAFIGTGHNPEGKDVPLGLGMNLAQDAEAMDRYSGLTQAQRDQIVDYVQKSTTGEDAKIRIHTVVQGLKSGQTAF